MIKEMLLKPEDKDLMDKKSGAIYWYQCRELAHNEENIGRHLGPLEKDIKST